MLYPLEISIPLEKQKESVTPWGHLFSWGFRHWSSSLNFTSFKQPGEPWEDTVGCAILIKSITLGKRIKRQIPISLDLHCPGKDFFFFLDILTCLWGILRVLQNH